MKNTLQTFISRFVTEQTQNGSPKLLGQQLERIRREIAAAGQKVYDEWEQDQDGVDEHYGSGGICDDIASEILDVIHSYTTSLPDEIASTTFFDQYAHHTYAVVGYLKTNECYKVDIPHYVYERGGGYNWEKIQGVQFTPDNVLIEVEDYENYFDEDGESLESW